MIPFKEGNMDKTKRRGFSILIAVLFLICIALLIAFFFPRGDTRQVAEDFSQANAYTEQELDRMSRQVFSHFRQNFKNCTLDTLTYEKEDEAMFDSEAKRYDAYAAVILRSDFTVHEDADPSFISGKNTDWKWIFIKKHENSSWKLAGWGYL